MRSDEHIGTAMRESAAVRHRVVMALGAFLVASVLGVGGALLFRDEASPRQLLLTSDNGCQAGGLGVITVPNVVGKRLGDAITAVRARGLLVIDDGVPAGDPSELSARVRAQMLAAALSEHRPAVLGGDGSADVGEHRAHRAEIQPWTFGTLD